MDNIMDTLLDTKEKIELNDKLVRYIRRLTNEDRHGKSRLHVVIALNEAFDRLVAFVPGCKIVCMDDALSAIITEASYGLFDDGHMLPLPEKD